MPPKEKPKAKPVSPPPPPKQKPVAPPKPAPTASSGAMKKPPVPPPGAQRSVVGGPAGRRPAQPSKPAASRPTTLGGPATVRPQAANLGAAGVSAASAELESTLASLSSELSSLAEGVSFNTHRKAIADLDKGLDELAGQVEQIRTRGYSYKGFLERKVETLQAKWSETGPIVRQQIEAAQAELKPLYDNLSRQHSNVSRLGAGAQGQVRALQTSTNDLKARVGAADQALRSTYDSLRQTYQQTRKQIDEVVGLLDQLDRSSFDLLASENPIQGVKAKWWRDGKNQGPEGILYLTDQRLLFEQKEKVATRKVLFIATESETKQELAFQVPVGAISACKATSQGLMGHEDHLDFDFSSGDFVNAHFHISGQSSEDWAALVKRVLNGEIERERVQLEGMASATPSEEAASLAPTRCDSCGAPVNAAVTRGQRQITCEFCGNVMRW